jgi:16S rRNA (guanine966-N2)-methyltransferase
MYKGRVLHTVKDLSVRPATDRVRQTIFNVLTHRMDLEGCRVLDLYAGSGSLGIEALSRGAAHATFIESNRQAVALLEENLRTLGCEDRSMVLSMDALLALDQMQKPFGLIFADPPYASTDTQGIPAMVFTRHLLRTPGFLVVEHPTSLQFTSTGLYAIGPVKRFGRTVVTFFSRTGSHEQDYRDLPRDI